MKIFRNILFIGITASVSASNSRNPTITHRERKRHWLSGPLSALLNRGEAVLNKYEDLKNPFNIETRRLLLYLRGELMCFYNTAQYYPEFNPITIGGIVTDYYKNLVEDLQQQLDRARTQQEVNVIAQEIELLKNRFFDLVKDKMHRLILLIDENDKLFPNKEFIKQLVSLKFLVTQAIANIHEHKRYFANMDWRILDDFKTLEYDINYYVLNTINEHRKELQIKLKPPLTEYQRSLVLAANELTTQYKKIRKSITKSSLSPLIALEQSFKALLQHLNEEATQQAAETSSREQGASDSDASN